VRVSDRPQATAVHHAQTQAIRPHGTAVKCINHHIKDVSTRTLSKRIKCNDERGGATVHEDEEALARLCVAPVTGERGRRNTV